MQTINTYLQLAGYLNSSAVREILFVFHRIVYYSTECDEITVGAVISQFYRGQSRQCERPYAATMTMPFARDTFGVYFQG